LLYKDLNTIIEEDLLGNWEMDQVFINQSIENNLLIQQRSIALLINNVLQLISEKEIEGKWFLLKQFDIIYNPQVKFELNQKEIGNAIITRFYDTTENSVIIRKLTLYFDTGLELILKKLIPQSVDKEIISGQMV